MVHVLGLALHEPVTSFPGHILFALQYSNSAQSLLEVHLYPSVAHAISNGNIRSIADLTSVIMCLLKFFI